MNPETLLPALRPLEVLPWQGEDGRPQFVLQDNAQIAPQPIAIGLPGFFVLTYCTGAKTLGALQAAFREQFGADLPVEQVVALLIALDEGLFLDNETFAAAYAQRVAAYRAAPARDNSAGWPDGATLERELQALLADADGVSSPLERAPRGLIAPHLDYPRGRPCYAAAYGALRNVPPAARYVILGTNHAGRATGPVVTTKDFQTPLGCVETDRALIARLEARLGASLGEYELDHLHEHSVELQVHLLQTLYPDAALRIVPVLCPDPCADEQTAAQLDALAEALQAVLAEDPDDTLIIAGADLSHVGQRFGETEPTDAAFLEGVARQDQQLLDLIAGRKDAEFVRALRAAGNPTRVCSAGCIYTALRALPGRPCHVLKYHQAVDFSAETHVTCAAAVIA